jgi:hypothetical protein
MIKFLSILLGFDNNILKSKEGRSADIFPFILLYMLILSISLYACYYAGYLLTDNVFSAALLSLFLTYIMHNMYRLIIATSYEGNSLTTTKEIYKYISVKGFLVVILSIFISCSLCVSVFNSEINLELKYYKSNLASDYEKSLSSSYRSQIADLEQSYENEKALNLLMNKTNSINDNLVLQENLLQIEQLKQSKIETFNSSILASNFFIQRVVIISNHPKFWIITIMSVLFFLWPLYIFNSSEYFLNYQLTIVNNNNKLVLTEYNNFKNTYINLLSVKSGQEITINERYEDPPFNTIPLTREDMILQKGSLLEWIKEYHG